MKKLAVGILIILVLGGRAVFLADLMYPDYTVYSYLDVTETEENISDQEVFPYRNLTSRQKSTFKKAVENPNSTIIPEDVDSHVWVEEGYVEYKNSTYKTAVAQN